MFILFVQYILNITNKIIVTEQEVVVIEDSAQNTEEEIIDNPPSYEAPPEYADVIKIIRRSERRRLRRSIRSDGRKQRICSRCDQPRLGRAAEGSADSENSSIHNFNRSCQTTPLPIVVPQSPPPPYSLGVSNIPTCSTVQHCLNNLTLKNWGSTGVSAGKKLFGSLSDTEINLRTSATINSRRRASSENIIGLVD